MLKSRYKKRRQQQHRGRPAESDKHLTHKLMDASRLLLLVAMVTSTSHGKSEVNASVCSDLDEEEFRHLEGEAFYFVPYGIRRPNRSEFRWYKSSPETKNISSDETETVHHHGEALFFLNLLPADAGLYVCQEIRDTGKCIKHHLKIEVFDTSFREDQKVTYGPVQNGDKHKEISCPDPVTDTCEALNGNFTWYKDFKLLPGKHEAVMWVEDATKADEGIYTCVCTWRHDQNEYNASASRRLIHEDTSSYDVQIISPTDEVQLADEGHEIQLNCSAYCGKNAKHECRARWNINEKPVDINSNRYNQTTKIIIKEPSKKTIATAILTIKKVSAQDFKDKFECVGGGLFNGDRRTLILKRRATVIPLVIGGVSVFFLCVFAAIMVKCFAIDLALFFRPYLPLGKHKEDRRVYDAYVVYQAQKMDKATEEMLSRFIIKDLPDVLEKKCGYRLFIHGRDDIPGEDHLEQVEDCMKQSRRLMVILTPGSGSGPEVTDRSPTSAQTAVLGGFDWQFGLHHALIQREMSVILIQLGDTGPQGYTNFPPGLQHLILKSAPLRWPESSRGASDSNSRFWKRVRYLMPAVPARKCAQAAIV